MWSCSSNLFCEKVLNEQFVLADPVMESPINHKKCHKYQTVGSGSIKRNLLTPHQVEISTSR